MHKVLSILFACVIGTAAHAQIKAVTEEGDEVMLHADGTWAYVEADVAEIVALPTNPNTFTKSSNSTFLLKSKTLGVGVYLNPKKWKFNKPENNDDAEFEFEMKGEDAYGLIITERMSIPIENLKQLAYENAKSVSSDLRIVEQEYRIVNGVKVIYMVMAAKVHGIDIYYLGYYYSSPEGSVQFLCYTGAGLVQQYEDAITELLNGFVKLD